MTKKIQPGKKVEYVNWPCMEIFESKVRGVTYTTTLIQKKGKPTQIKKSPTEIEMTNGDKVKEEDIITTEKQRRGIRKTIRAQKTIRNTEMIWEMIELITQKMNEINEARRKQ